MSRVLVVGRSYNAARSEQAFLKALKAEGADVLLLPDLPSPVDAQAYDIVVSMRAMKLLASAPRLDWGQFSGKLIMYDADANQNYFSVGDSSRFRGVLPSVMRRHGFHEVIVTSSVVAERLRDEGLIAHWLPKGYDEEQFFDSNGERSGLCTFGSRYGARRALDYKLKNHAVPVDRLSVPYPDLSEALNRYSGCIVCNMVHSNPSGPLGGLMGRLAPHLFGRISLGPEMMIKNFEAAAAGCAVFADKSQDLDLLGFIDGVNVITYRDFNQLLDKIDQYGSGEMRPIGRASANFVKENHTWRHRARQLMDLVL